MAIYVYTGLPGSGKTTKLAALALDKLRKNEKDFKKYKSVRHLYTNIRFSPDVEKKYKRFIRYFDDIYAMPSWRDADIFVDELAVYFDSQEWDRTPKSIKRFLRLHRHYRIDIYGIAQDFKTVDNSFRRLTKELFYMHRVMGTREPNPNKPPIKRPFLLGMQRSVDRKLWELEKEHYDFISTEWFLHGRSTFEVFDTAQDLPEQPLPPLIKQVRVCPEDGYKRVRYI
jgi:hypothetical protein